MVEGDEVERPTRYGQRPLTETPNKMAKILIVDDDITLCASLREWLEEASLMVEVVHGGADAVDYLRTFNYDVVILDWELPQLNGVDICKKFRSAGGQTPILMLTGKGAIEAKQLGFDAGADDYLTKPFHSKELVSRVKALLRRPPQLTGPLISVGTIVLNINTRSLSRDGFNVALQPMEFELLEFLMRHPDQVFTTEAIIHRCWNADADVSFDAIYSCIKRLRKKVDVKGEPSLITTVHGSGYRLNSRPQSSR